MSDTPQGQGWWQASDGKWYPPEQHPSYQQPTTPGPPPAAPYSTASPSRSGSQSFRTPVPAEIAVLAGGAVALIFSFLPFYKLSFGSSSTNAWGRGVFPTATLITLFAVIAAALVAAALFDVSLPKRLMTFTKEQIIAACGLFATVLALAFLIEDRGSVDLGVGYWLMLLGAVAVLVGGILMLRAAPDATR